ncbi:MAG: hypothetical protein WA708_11235 [Acidobacteriaceae bacterium]
MKNHRFACAALLAGFFLCTLSPSNAVAQNPAAPENPASATLVVTAHGRGSHAVPQISQSDVTVLVNRRPAQITSWEAYRGANDRLQLVFLFDESARSYLALQFSSIRKFIDGLPPSAEVGIAYMSNGRAVFTQKLTSDHALAGKGLRLPNGIPGISASPYFCLSDLAKNWPSHAQSRRVVFMVTNGEDPYYRGGDLQDPYVRSAISDSQKARLVVYSIYFRNTGFNGRQLGVLYGQSYLLRVSDETGGVAYSEALSSPVSFDPFLKQFKTSLDNQYQLMIAAQGSGLQSVTVKSNMRGVKLKAATRVDLGSGQ